MTKSPPKNVVSAVWPRLVLYLAVVALVAGGRRVYLGLQREAVDVTDYDPVVKIEGDFRSGEALSEVLSRHELQPEVAASIGATLRKVFDPRRIRPGDRYVIEISTGGDFLHLTLERDLMRYVVTQGPSEGALAAAAHSAPLNTLTRSAAGRLESSVWESLSARDVPPEVIDGFENAFRFTIDFLTEPRDGDAFALEWEETRTPRGRVVSTRILAALYEGQVARSNSAILFQNAYWNAAGDSLSRMFLAAPLKRYRISSRFTTRRFHPVRRVFRAHLGIDYAAPTGTPIVAVGAGTVSYLGWKGGFGRTVMIKHANRYETLYGHLSRYRHGLKQGAKVAQGDVVGYVGSSGVATGPHLDFRIKHDGKWRNFLTMDIPADQSIPAGAVVAFETVKNARLKRLRGLIRGL